METKDQIRERVAHDYAKALQRKPSGSCCGADRVDTKGIAAKVAGYAPDELAALPDDAVTNSFGCGNPVALARLSEGDVVLDLGSGAGIDILLAAKHVGPTGRVIGIDMTDEMIARANENIKASGLSNVEVRKGLIEDMPIESGTVDWVISNCVINLSPEKDRVFAEIARVLKPGGRVAVSDIVVEEMPQVVRDDPRLHSSCISGAISEDAYIQCIKDAGLTDVEVTDRIVYSEDHLAALAESEIPAEVSDSGGSCCSGASSDCDTLNEVARNLAGKIWSSYFVARKP
ncbi:MAG: methyltransferase domain-containing protein [Planctomycetes bacterium]|nr:methyltransferase domain-containing protein [Planctomycetota bacterium]NOG54905.1 arsenite methyltransferase [Planctomycetota bacterium]